MVTNKGRFQREKSNRKRKTVQVNSKDISVTPIIFLTVNHRQLSTFVDTGSSASLITISAVESLGLQGKIRNCNVYLRGISNHTLKLLGQLTATVRLIDLCDFWHVAKRRSHQAIQRIYISVHQQKLEIKDFIKHLST